jgi:hypothetical protein
MKQSRKECHKIGVPWYKLERELASRPRIAREPTEGMPLTCNGKSLRGNFAAEGSTAPRFFWKEWACKECHRLGRAMA